MAALKHWSGFLDYKTPPPQLVHFLFIMHVSQLSDCGRAEAASTPSFSHTGSQVTQGFFPPFLIAYLEVFFLSFFFSWRLKDFPFCIKEWLHSYHQKQPVWSYFRRLRLILEHCWLIFRRNLQLVHRKHSLPHTSAKDLPPPVDTGHVGLREISISFKHS